MVRLVQGGSKPSRATAEKPDNPAATAETGGNDGANSVRIAAGVVVPRARHRAPNTESGPVLLTYQALEGLA